MHVLYCYLTYVHNYDIVTISLSQSYKSELQAHLVQSRVPSLTLQLLETVLPSVVAGVDQTACFGSSTARQAMVDLSLADKEVEYTDSLMVCVCVCVCVLRGGGLIECIGLSRVLVITCHSFDNFFL